MTYTARFKVTEVANGHVHAVASVDEGTLTQNTEHATRMELLVSIDPEHETTIKVGDEISGHGHFSG